MTCLQLALANSKVSVHRIIVPRTAGLSATANTARAAVFVRTAGEETFAKTAGAFSTAAPSASEKPAEMGSLRGETLHFAKTRVIELGHIATATEICQRTKNNNVA